ncbi:MAG TPA: hypothetical protein VMM36_14655 [Opitutaceae bacterium]|nr:hypothetical protein [Opitutaceae bacterium]
MPSSTSSFERPVPAMPWTGLAVAAYIIAAVVTIAWEFRVRSEGYAPTLNDTTDLWADRREAVRPDSLVVIGDSRPLFDIDFDALEAVLGKRPVQLAIAGSGAYPILDDLANDESFKGDVIISLVPAMFMTPGGYLEQASRDALKRYKSRGPAQRFSHHIAMFLEERIAFLQQEDLTLGMLLQDINIPNRPGALVPPRFPPYFQTADRERRVRMADECAIVGSPMQQSVVASWQRLFRPPAPPSWIPPEVFFEQLQKGMEARFGESAAAIAKIRARGGRVVWVRFPHTGWVKEMENVGTPRAPTWDRMIKETGAPGIHFEDHPELAGFDCPEWSHLSGPDSVEFSKRLAPHLKRAFEEQQPKS